MNTKTHIEFEVEKTLESVDSFQRYEGRPFLHTRVMAQLNKPSGKRKVIPPRLILQPCVLGFVLLLNIFSGLYFFTNRTNGNQSRDQYIDQLAEEFSISNTSYDISNLIEGE